MSPDRRYLSNGEELHERILHRGRQIYVKNSVSNELLYTSDVGVDIIKNWPRLLEVGALSEKNHRSKFKPTDFEPIFPDMTFNEQQDNMIYEAFLLQNIVAATDRSVKNGMGAGAFCLATNDGNVCIMHFYSLN